MKASEMRTFNDQQLEEQLVELLAEWRVHRFDEAVGSLTHTARVRQIRRDIARIHTIRTEREIDAAASQILAGAGR